MDRSRIMRPAVLLAVITIFSLMLLGRIFAAQTKKAETSQPSPTSAPALNTEAIRQALEEAQSKMQGTAEGTPSEPETSGVETPVFEAKATPEEEHATYLALQEKKMQEERQVLEALKKELKDEIAKLETLRADIDKRMADEDEATKKKLSKLVKIYEAMRPDELVPVLDKLDDELRLQVLSRMKQKVVSQILVKMDPAKAAVISEKLMSKKAK